ncbi:MAG: hypothetical protein WDM88_05115 [Galbitalea sp.]
MQLGTRWPAGGEPPERLSDAMKAAIAGVEEENSEAETDQWRWTLTWLEGRAHAEFEDGTLVREDHDGSVVVIPAEPSP